jgi:hypothetical protein
VVNGILLKKVEQEVEISFGPKRAPQACSHSDSAIALFEIDLTKRKENPEIRVKRLYYMLHHYGLWQASLACKCKILKIQEPFRSTAKTPSLLTWCKIARAPRTFVLSAPGSAFYSMNNRSLDFDYFFFSSQTHMPQS